MRVLLLSLCLVLPGCQSERVSDAAGGGPGAGPAGPPPESGDLGPDGGGPDRDAPVTARLEGVLVHEAFTGGMLQVDVVGERDGTQQVVGMERYEQPGPFRIAVRGDFQAVDLIVYVDVDGDGPSAGDLRVEYAGNPIAVGDVEVVEGLTVDLADAEAQDGTPKEAAEDADASSGDGEVPTTEPAGDVPPADATGAGEAPAGEPPPAQDAAPE